MRSEAVSYKHTVEKLGDYRRQIDALRQKMRDVQAAVEPEDASRRCRATRCLADGGPS
jgi:hypothetical protein